MLKIQEIRELIKLINSSSIDEFSYEHEGSKIKLKKNKDVVTTVVPQVEQKQAAVAVAEPAPTVATPAPVQVTSPVPTEAKATEVDANLHKIVSPMVGTFYASPNPDSPAYVKVGDKVGKESVVCIVEAMKLFNEIEAEVSGQIVEVLVENGQLVEYGQPLFLVKPE
ncbi:acetyl-CoA carboxylase biotin carboxyl carrier protein [Bacillus suaedaesalsae]|uniref:Biotin carboxyl carrier protein of acetyl-CoA carboxylase n=1 Tax=Bacillus suaedaesalsae TaxID=2810349 RepID=A0ABS2DFX4_9BACI|nr:acetyl-CoA carboxylase biotin carboxyl carrier protein [Bacillus suaedaesalsae]